MTSGVDENSKTVVRNPLNEYYIEAQNRSKLKSEHELQETRRT